MAEYLTEQKKMLVDILEKDKDKELSIEQIIEELRSEYKKDAPGKSTVYRLITKMVDEGKIRRLPKGKGRKFVYQLIESEHCHSHLHLKCVDCGRLIHLEKRLTEELTERVRAEKDFFVIEENTVLFGRCSSCGNGGQKI